MLIQENPKEVAELYFPLWYKSLVIDLQDHLEF